MQKSDFNGYIKAAYCSIFIITRVQLCWFIRMFRKINHHQISSDGQIRIIFQTKDIQMLKHVTIAVIKVILRDIIVKQRYQT